MIEPTSLANYVTPATFMAHAIKATSSLDIEALLSQLPIAPEDEYIHDDENPNMSWQSGKFSDWARQSTRHRALQPVVGTGR